MSTGRLLATGGAGALVFNFLFPRADDPWDPESVLAMMAASPLRRQLSFLGATVAVLLIAGAVIELARESDRAGSRWGRALVGLGAVAFSVASALGMAATAPAQSWADAGSDVDYVLAVALNRADDFVWFASIVFLWTGFGLIGAALRESGVVSRRSSFVLACTGFATAAGVGLPLLAGVEWIGLFFAFGLLATVTAVWALVVGVSPERRART